MTRLGRHLGRWLHALGVALVDLGNAYAGTEDLEPEPLTTWPGDYLADEIERENA